MGFDPQLLLPALDEAADFIIVFDDSPAGRGGPFILYVNRSFLEATGYSHDDLIGQSYARLVSTRNNPQIMQSILRAIENHTPNSKEMLATRKDGSDFWVEFVAKPWHTGGSEYWLTIARDITLRRRSLSQMALLFAAIENTSDCIALYEPTVENSLELTYENERAFESGNGRLLQLWNSESTESKRVREGLEAGHEIHEYFAEIDSSGFPKLVQFNARAIKSDARIEGIVTLERTLASARGEHAESYESLLLRIAALLPTLAQAQSPLERYAMLRAILLDAFDAELYEVEAPLPAQLAIAAGANLARFPLGGKSMLVRWSGPLESTALTALRFCIEAAMEQERLRS